MDNRKLCKAPAKRSQHFNATYRKIVGCNMLRVFGHHAATCSVLLAQILKMVKLTQHLWMLHDVVVVWPGSYSNVTPGHAHYFDFQLATCGNTLKQGGKTRATCCAQQCCDLLRLNVAIIWPELANAGPTMLGYVALKCCYRLAGSYIEPRTDNRRGIYFV